MTITLQPELEEKLRETAQREGVEVEALAHDLLIESLEQKTRVLTDDIAAVQEGIDALREGRERPFDEFLSEHRTRHGSNRIK